MRLLAAALALSVTQATADDARINVREAALRALVEQNQSLREDNERLDAESDKWRKKYQTLSGMIGSCT